MKRAWIVGLIVTSVLVVLAVIGNSLVQGWTGDRSMRVAKAGDVITMDNGLTITVPDGWNGYYAQYYRIPRWVGVGEAAGLMRSDRLDIGSMSGTSPQGYVMAWSYYEGAAPPRADAPFATSPGLRAYQSSGVALVETSIPGRERGVIAGSYESTVGVGLLNYLWNTLQVSGAKVPE